jgi:hypothetical protein
MIPPRMVLLQLLQVRLWCACLLAAALVSFLERCNALVVWWWCIQVLWHDDTREDHAGLLESLSVCLNVWSWYLWLYPSSKHDHNILFSYRQWKKERKVEWKKENLDDLLALWSKYFSREIIPVRISIFALYLCRPWVYSVPWQQVSVHKVMIVFQASIIHNVWFMGLGLWISGFCRHCRGQWHKFSTVSNSLVNLRFTSSKSYWLDNVNQAAVLFVCLLW